MRARSRAWSTELVVLGVLVCVAVLVPGCLGSDTDTPREAGADARPQANETATALPGNFSYPCPGGEGLERGNGVCVRTIADPTTSIQEPYLDTLPEKPNVVALGANAVPTADALDPERSTPGIDREEAVVLVSEDSGATWSWHDLPYVGEDDAGPVDVAESWGPRVAWSANGSLAVTGFATQKSPIRGGDVFATTSPDRGGTWSIPQPLTSDDDNDGYWFSRGPDGTLYRPWTSSGSTSSVEVAWKTPGDEGWTHLAEGGAAQGCTTTSTVVHQESTPYLVCTLEADDDPAGLDEDPTGLAVYRLDETNRSLHQVGRIDSLPGYYPDLTRFADGSIHVATEANGTILTSGRPSASQGWTEPTDLRQLLGIEDGWSFADLHYWKQGPTGAVHLLLYGARDADGPGNPSVPTPIVAHAAVTPGLDRVLAERVLWTSTQGLDGPPATLAPGDGTHAFGIAFGEETGYLAWTQEGTIGLTRLVPGSARSASS